MDACRKYWLTILERLCRAPLDALSQRALKARMPYYGWKTVRTTRQPFMYMEVLCRILAGISPWLEAKGLPKEEESRRAVLSRKARACIDAATDPESADFMDFSVGSGDQPAVEAACLALAFFRAPTELWHQLDDTVKNNVISSMKATRKHTPGFNNHLLFSAAVEAFLCKANQDWDQMRIDYAIRQHQQWYLGDSIYSDGPSFKWDYYNSFVIHPFLIEILSAVKNERAVWGELWSRVIDRGKRYAVIQERLISPEGTFPAIGRSLTYRFGAFHHLAKIALMRELPAVLSPAQVRCALTAVIKRMMDHTNTFDKDGWLMPGFVGHQPELGEQYITTGSLYYCMMGLLPLGLSPDDDFWKSPAEEWTSRKLWSGGTIPIDQALEKRVDQQ